jgi:hypothetical protein
MAHECERSSQNTLSKNGFKTCAVVHESDTISKNSARLAFLYVKLPHSTDASNFFLQEAELKHAETSTAVEAVVYTLWSHGFQDVHRFHYESSRQKHGMTSFQLVLHANSLPRKMVKISKFLFALKIVILSRIPSGKHLGSAKWHYSHCKRKFIAVTG